MKLLNISCALSLLFSGVCFAAGMVPATSLLLINEEEGGASMDVKNTDNEPGLLYTYLKEVDGESLRGNLIVTQPVVRVEAGQTQRVRFVLNQKTPLTTEHLKRVVFTTIPRKENNKLKMVIGQDLPVIIHPKGLPVVTDPWKNLSWSFKGNTLSVKNNTAYVVRMASQLKMLPSGNKASLPGTFILPGQTLTATAAQPFSAADNKVEMYPATRYGYASENYIASLTQ